MIDAGQCTTVGRPLRRARGVAAEDPGLIVAARPGETRPRAAQPWLAHGCFAVLAAGVAVVHLIVLTRNGEPSGLDFGNWLTIGHHWLGIGAPGGSRSTYPPVVPLLAVAAVTTMGVSYGTAVLAALGGLAPAIATYLVLARHAPRVAAITVALAIAAAGSTGEAVAWGGVPQLIGLGFGLATLATFVNFLHHPRRLAAWRSGILLATTGATTHLVLAQVAVCMAAILLAHLAFRSPGVSARGPWRHRDGLVGHLLRLATPVLPLTPLYVTLSGSVGQSFVSRTTTVSWTTKTLDAFGSIFGDAPLLWKTAMMLTLLAPFALLHRRREPLWVLTTAILMTDIATVALTGEDRLAYLAPLGIATGLGLISCELAARLPTAGRLAVVAAMCGLSALAVDAGLKHFSAQRTYYGERLLPTGTTAALDWIRLHTSARAVVAVAPVDSLPFGWWVEGYGRRAALTGASELYLNFPQERQRAREAIALLGLTAASPAQFAAQAGDLHVDYVYIPAGWHGLDGTSLQRYVSLNPSAVVFRNSAALIVRLQR